MCRDYWLSCTVVGLLGGVDLKSGERASQQRLQGSVLICHAGSQLFANINLHSNVKLECLSSRCGTLPDLSLGCVPEPGHQLAPRLEPVLPGSLVVRVHTCACVL